MGTIIFTLCYLAGGYLAYKYTIWAVRHFDDITRALQIIFMVGCILAGPLAIFVTFAIYHLPILIEGRESKIVYKKHKDD